MNSDYDYISNYWWNIVTEQLRTGVDGITATAVANHVLQAYKAVFPARA